MTPRFKRVLEAGFWFVLGFIKLRHPESSSPYLGAIAMTVGKSKRPRDPNQLAAWTVAVSTGQIPEPQAEVVAA
jgi:hypothetical protein